MNTTESNTSWIQSLYNRTWEMELLLSGFAIVLIFQSFDVFFIINHWAEYQIADGEWQVLAKGFSVVWWFSCVAICIFLIINLLFRAYWIALIGLMSGSKGLNEHDNFSVNPKHNQLLQQKYQGLTQHAQSVDDKGSQIFAVAFLIVCFTLSIVVFFSQLRVLGAIARWEPSLVPLVQVFMYVYTAMAAVFLLDVLFSGLLRTRRNKTVARVIYWNYRILRYPLGVFLYERLMLNVQTNSRLSSYISISIAASFFVWMVFEDERAMFSSQTLGVVNQEKSRAYSIVNLESYSLPGHLTQVALEKEVVNTLPVSLRIPLTKTTARSLKQACGDNSSGSTYEHCLSKAFNVHIDGTYIETKWFTKRDIDRRTLYLASHIAPDTLQTGQHQISVSLPFLADSLKTHFWYYPSRN